MLPTHASFAYQNARRVLSINGKTFALAGKLLDSSTLNSCARLYRFCRYIDDIADTASDNRAALERIDKITCDLKVGLSDDPVLADFIELSSQYNFDMKVTFELLDGMRSDLLGVRVYDHDELLRYCYRVAGTVGLHMCSVFSVTDHQARAHAIDLGIAMQLTNICRDVVEDAKELRRYLPATHLHHLPPGRILHPTEFEAKTVKSTVKSLLDLADKYYYSAELGYEYLPLRVRLTIAVAARMYRGIGDVIRRRDYDVWLGRAVVPSLDKYKLASYAIYSTFRRSKGPRTPHNRSLHASLAQLPSTNC